MHKVKFLVHLCTSDLSLSSPNELHPENHEIINDSEDLRSLFSRNLETLEIGGFLNISQFCLLFQIKRSKIPEIGCDLQRLAPRHRERNSDAKQSNQHRIPGDWRDKKFPGQNRISKYCVSRSLKKFLKADTAADILCWGVVLKEHVTLQRHFGFITLGMCGKSHQHLGSKSW